MIINPEILAILDKNKIDRHDALTYLIALYNKLNPSYIPDLLKRQIYANGILNRGETEGTVVWTVPLFKDPVEKPKKMELNLDWVLSEYREMFRSIRADAGGDKQSCTGKMKIFLSNNPDVTKDEIIAATNQYLDQFKTGRQSAQYLQRADYFIFKVQNVGGSRTQESRLGEYIEIVRKLRKQDESQSKYIMR